MWQNKRQCLLDTLKDDIGDSVFISNTFPLRSDISIQDSHFYIFWHWFVIQCGDSARQSKTIQHIYCHPEQIIPHTIDCRG